MASNGGLRGPRWDSLRRQVLIRDSHCHLCGEPVNKTLSGRHERGPVVDHIVPKSKGGAVFDLANLALAHRKCNTSKGATAPTYIDGAKPSRNWLEYSQ